MAVSWNWIIWHTTAHGDVKKKVDCDTTVEDLNRWHLRRGMKKAGYHYLVRKDGSVHPLRTLVEPGAHTRGMNKIAIGIAFSGHGDIKPLTEAQRKSGLDLTFKLMKRFRIPYTHVIGHREVNSLIAQGVVKAIYRVNKTCPGKFIPMAPVRVELRKRVLSDTT